MVIVVERLSRCSLQQAVLVAEAGRGRLAPDRSAACLFQKDRLMLISEVQVLFTCSSSGFPLLRWSWAKRPAGRGGQRALNMISWQEVPGLPGFLGGDHCDCGLARSVHLQQAVVVDERPAGRGVQPLLSRFSRQAVPEEEKTFLIATTRTGCAHLQQPVVVGERPAGRGGQPAGVLQAEAADDGLAHLLPDELHPAQPRQNHGGRLLEQQLCPADLRLHEMYIMYSVFPSVRFLFIA